MTLKCKCHLYLLPLIILFFIIASYYVYIIIFCIPVVTNLLETCLYILFFHIFFVMLLWSFLATMFTRIARVPPIYKLNDEELELLNRSDDVNKSSVLRSICVKKNIVLVTCFPANSIRYCVKCKHIKPDRAHHCSVCRTCVLKMDHHCPWVNNCIGFSNYKYFVLLQFYTALYCLYILCTSINYVPKLVQNEFSVQGVIVSFVVVICYGTFGVVLLICHGSLLSKNKTTLEQLQKTIFTVGNATYNLGCRRNFLEVFGNKWQMWPFPFFSSLGNGCTFDLKLLDQNPV